MVLGSAPRRNVVQYLLMCCFNENRWMELPDSHRNRIMDEYGVFIENVKKSGCYIAGAKLDESSSAVTVRVKNGRAATTDGPFAETKEQLGGYHLVECRDLDEALSLARRIPTLPVGGAVEVRAVLHTA
jgi:hypothetical protein